jgi:predicted dehydrogenase
MNKMLIVGCGSIGRRHLVSFRNAGAPFIAGADPRAERLEQAAKQGGLDAKYADYKAALSEHKFDAVVLASPTSMHVEMAVQAAEAGCHLFIEKPVSHNLEHLNRLESVCREKRLSVLVAYCHRFLPSVKKVKELIDSGRIGRIYAATMNWGSFLPSWHPWEDYRSFYMAKKALGGGALLDESHGIDLLRYLLGNIDWVSGDVGTISELEIDSDDWASLLFRTQDGIHGKAHFDLLRQDAQVKLEIIGQRGSITWDRIDHRVTVFDASTKSYEVFPYTAADVLSMYATEAEHFISCVRNKTKPEIDLQDGIRTLQVVMGVFESARTGHAVTVGNG